MKRLALIIVLVLAAFSLFAQGQTDSLPPYKKYPTLPAFEILLHDSSSVFNTYDIPKGKPTILMYFSPDCDHCEQMAADILKNMDELGKVQIYMITPMSLSVLQKFYQKLELSKYKNIVAGKDHQFFFTDFYQAKYVPYIVIYDKHKQVLATWDGDAKIKDIKAVLSK